ncbi:pyridoxal-phosphate dependent enzyme [uncultured Dokdonia sp.]|uniref:1-aminocyclopropane-1-carboxylate deaminase/D-cysteine desulfhydrase n=1 Tax=uncultured Dokdonia sp. TaxID=575653 RepID=UPI00261D0584|nr:pyridoxal-phosphate dependent enzyme [uncultured Dokdonia sp.]
MIETTQNQGIPLSNTIRLSIKREDLIHPYISGNKYRKLKYNIAFAKANNYKTLLTFGGAYSNHIAATAVAGKRYNFDTIGIIRGDELGKDVEKTLSENKTLARAVSFGMKLKFISRTAYKQKEEQQFLDALKKEYPDAYILPEGGTNELAIKGCEEILTPSDLSFDYICCAVGTGGTISGIINASDSSQKILGFPALKGNFLEDEIQSVVKKKNWQLVQTCHFGGYAKVTDELVRFMNEFKKSYNIVLDPIYTGKMMYGIFDLISQGYFPQNSRILAIHTGGLQGVEGINKRLEKKGLQTIDI